MKRKKPPLETGKREEIKLVVKFCMVATGREGGVKDKEGTKAARVKKGGGCAVLPC